VLTAGAAPGSPGVLLNAVVCASGLLPACAAAIVGKSAIVSTAIGFVILCPIEIPSPALPETGRTTSRRELNGRADRR
jgi:hypothetical protein